MSRAKRARADTSRPAPTTLGTDNQPRPEDLETVARIKDSLFAEQLALVEDKSRFRSMRVGRGGGKTVAMAADMVIACLEQPSAPCYYIVLTKTMAKGILWDNPRTGIKALDEQFELNLHYNNAMCIATFPNGSRIHLMGCERTSEVDKMRGIPMVRATFDECKSIPTGTLQMMVEDIIGPRMGDYRGIITVGGTPGSVLSGMFYDATRNEPEERLPIWSFHDWDVSANTKMPHLWEEALIVKQRNRWDDDHETWMREYRGKWTADSSNLVYRFDEKNTWRGGSPEEDHDWSYVCGLYLSLENRLGVCVVAFSETHPTLFHVHDSVRDNASTDDIANTIELLEDFYGTFDNIVGFREGRGDAIFRDLEQHHGLQIEIAKRQNLADLVVLVNNDFKSGLIKVGANSHLETELKTLQWLDPGLEFNLDSSSAVVSTALLYAWEHSFHRDSHAKASVFERGTPEWFAAEERKAIRKAEHEWENVHGDGDEDDVIDAMYNAAEEEEMFDELH